MTAGRERESGDHEQRGSTPMFVSRKTADYMSTGLDNLRPVHILS